MIGGWTAATYAARSQSRDSGWWESLGDQTPSPGRRQPLRSSGLCLGPLPQRHQENAKVRGRLFCASPIDESAEAFTGIFHGKRSPAIALDPSAGSTGRDVNGSGSNTVRSTGDLGQRRVKRPTNRFQLWRSQFSRGRFLICANSISLSVTMV